MTAHTVRGLTPATADPELVAVAALGAAALRGTVHTIRDVHGAVAERVYRRLGVLGLPSRFGHDLLARGVYTAVAGSLSAGAAAGGGVAARFVQRRVAPDGSRLSDRPRGNVLVGIINGGLGDRLQARENPLATRMAIRARGSDVLPTRQHLSAAFPHATEHVLVFLHGLCETDLAWWLDATRHWGDARSTHGSRLADEAGYTPVYLRYNTGLHISANGLQLSALLDSLVAEWPVPLRSLTLVGHSMGGLVVRAACYSAMEPHREWLDPLRRVVYLGSPHLGAPLEVGATALGCALRALPETRPFARMLAARSVGIKDLRYGAVLETDWTGQDPDAWRAEPAAVCALYELADHYYIGATVSSRREHVAGRVLGDLLVPYSSASGTGRRRRLGFAVDAGCHVGRLHHFDLLNHPQVYRQLRGWLAVPPE
jgi:hypothetical protein